jgi:glycosyltransferase involved in cell wall biosynthesis
VIADARETLRRELGVASDRKLLVFMSRYHEKKGIELLIDACATMGGDFDLVLAGTGDESYVATLQQRIAAAGLAPRVHWRGFVQGHAKWQLLQGGDLFVLPSHSENFGIVVAEAIACGLPVIVSDQVALKEEVLAHQLGAVVPLHVTSLRLAMERLLAADGERHAIRDRAMKVAREHFSWPAAAKRLISAYSDSLTHP